MTNSTMQEVTSEWDDTRFHREKRSGVFMGLGWLQLGYMAAGVAVLLVFYFILPFPWSQLVALAGAAFLFCTAVPTPMGRPLIEWVLFAVVYTLRGAWGFLRFRREWHKEPVREDDEDADVAERATVDKKGRIKPGKPWRLHLIGEFDELLVYTMPNGSAFVFDPRKKEIILTARIQTEKAFDLESFESRESRTRGFKEMLTGVTRLPGIHLASMSDQTTMISGQHVARWYHNRQNLNGVKTGADVDPFLHSSLETAMQREQGMPVHEMWLTIVVGADDVRNQGKPNKRGIGGLMDAVQSTMNAVEHSVMTSGAEVTTWHTPRSLSALIRGAFDPESSVEISERTGEREGVAPTSAGPMAVDVHRGYLSTDSGLHRTFMISEWPQFGARFGFLSELVFLGDFRHTVTVVMKPREQRKALKSVRGRKATHETSERQRKRWGGVPSLEHAREGEDLEEEERHLVEGAAALQQVGLVTVTGRDEAELEAHTSTLLTRTPAAGCEVRPLWWQQDSGFVAAALPLGRIDVR